MGNVYTAFTQNQPQVYDYANHSAYYALYPMAFRPFADRYQRIWGWWYDGFVPTIHSGGNAIVSTKLGLSLCNRLSALIFGNGFVLNALSDKKNAKDSLHFLSDKWMEEAQFNDHIANAIDLYCGLGTSYIKTNVNGKGECRLEVFRADQAYCDIDGDCNVIRGKFIVDRYTKTIPNKQEENYFICEERFIATPKDVREYQKNHARHIYKLDNRFLPYLEVGKSYYELKVYKMVGTISNQTYSVNSDCNVVDWEQLPSDFKQYIENTYGTLMINRPLKLPFEDTGCDVFRYTIGVRALGNVPFGESALHTIQTDLFDYDFACACENTDRYIGRGRVLLPKSIQSPQGRGASNSKASTDIQSYNSGSDSSVFSQMSGIDPEQQKPTPIQFELRTEEHGLSKKNIIANIAMKLGVGVGAISDSMEQAVYKNINQINDNSSATSLFVDKKRKIIEAPLNKLIKRICTYYGKSTDIKIAFSQKGKQNDQLIIEEVIKLKANGLMGLYDAVRFMFPDKNEEEVQTYMKRVREEEEHLQYSNNSLGARPTDEVKTGLELTKKEKDININVDSGKTDNKNREPKLKSPK